MIGTQRAANLPPDERIVIALVSLLAIAPAWLRGGTYAGWTYPILLASLAVFAVIVALSWHRGRLPGSRPSFIAWKDPVLWLGLLFLGLLVVQWWNSGRILYFDTALREWTYSPAKHANLPSAFTAGEARQMLDWFVPAWVILAVLRSPAFGARSTRILWRVLVINAAVLSLFGVIQFASGTTNMYGVIPMRPHFFASFGYPNHAGSYFLMMIALAAGLLSREIARPEQPRRWLLPIVLGVSFLLILIGANLALSRLSILLSWLLLIPLGIYLTRFLWPRLSPVQRLNLFGAGFAIVILALILVIGLGREAIKTEFKPEDDNKTFLQRETHFRIFQLQTAFLIWKDHPWFGVGGWGYRYLLGHYLPPEEWRRITEGKANVHNDPLQFLAEFGIVGAGSMGAVVLLLAVSAIRGRREFPPLLVFPLVGVVLVAGQSLIDLPFRSPAVLYAWLICLAGAARAVPIARRTPEAPIPPQPS